MPLSTIIAQSSPDSGAIYWVDKIARTSLTHILILAAALTVVRLAIAPYIKNTPQHLRTGTYSFAKIANEICDAVIYAAIVVFMIVRPFGIQTFHIPTGSMLQTLQEGDFIIANKLIYRYTDPKHGDIVVFHPPHEAFFKGQEETDFIKRLIGVPGDVIEMKNMVLYRNGKALDEPYQFYDSDGGRPPFTPLAKDQWHTLQDETPDFKFVDVDGKTIPLLYKGGVANSPIFNTMPAYQLPNASSWIGLPAAKIPDGYYFFMGDHRNGSLDGRMWGLVPRANIIGRSEFVLLPLSGIRKTR
ncbi:MAG TPA: signal peptidase I [Fimbriimonadaceae bacterium]|nr:signal peptidase I [Fimbriimonadaceae bacterium]